MSSEGTKILDLVDPSKKMSKSSENQNGVIRLLDDEGTIVKKIMRATTDSDMKVLFDEENKPGISNLINIYASLTDMSISEVEEKFKDANYGTFKREVADVVVKELSEIQNRYNEILNSKELDEILNKGKEKTRELASKKLREVKEKIGFYE